MNHDRRCLVAPRQEQVGIAMALHAARKAHSRHSKTPTNRALACVIHRRLLHLRLPGVAAVPRVVCSERTPCVPECQYPVKASRPAGWRTHPQPARLPGGLAPTRHTRDVHHVHSESALTRCNAHAAGGEVTRHQSFHCSRLVKASRSTIPGTILTLLCGPALSGCVRRAAQWSLAHLESALPGRGRHPGQVRNFAQPVTRFLPKDPIAGQW